jgi:hypothetical protein
MDDGYIECYDAMILECFVPASPGTSPTTIEFAVGSYFYLRQLSDGTIMQIDYLTAAKFKTREGYQVIESERALDVR